METIVLHITSNENEYARAVGEHAVKVGNIVRTNVIYFVVCVTFFFGFILYTGAQGDFLAYLPILLTVGLFGSMPFVFPRKWKQQFRADPGNARPLTWEISGQTITVKDGLTQIDYQWSVFRPVLETEEFFFLILSANKDQYFYLPKRAFASKEQMEQFRALVKAKAG